MIISDFIYTWLKDIVVLFIIITLVDLIMPKGHLKRYMNFIIGLILIFMVISPFLNLLSLDLELEKHSINESGNQEVEDIDFTKQQTEKIESLYIDKISSEIDMLVEEESNYKVNDIKIDIDKSELYFGQIIHINMELINKNHENKGDKIQEINIEKINKVPEKKEEDIIKKDQDEFKELKMLISKELGVPIDVIIIYVNS